VSPGRSVVAPPGVLPLGEVARLVEGRLHGDADHEIRGVAPVADAGPQELGFLAARAYLDHLEGSDAGAFLVTEELAEHVGDRPHVAVDDAHHALQRLLTHLYPGREPEPGIHPTAILGEGVELGHGVCVGPYAVVGKRSRIGAGSWIGPHAVLGEGVEIGEDARVHPHVVLYDGTQVGNRVILHAGARLGVDGFGWAVVDDLPRKMPHVGRCVVGDDVEIGANSTLDRGSIGETRVGNHAKLDNLVHLAHNVHLGGGSLLAALVGIAGSTRVGSGVLMGGQSGIINHLEIGDGVQIAAASKVLRDVPAGETISGHPARPNREYLRKQAHLSRLPKLVARVAELERRLEALEGDD